MTTGLVLGKFMPPHNGHVHLCTFAASMVDRLCIVVGSLPSEPIPGTVRHAWMTELFPHCDVVHLPDDLPQLPEDHPDFWALWKHALTRVAPYPIDVVIASEDYGHRLASELDATFIPCDTTRSAVPISGSAIRESPMRHWEHLPSPVRPWFLRRVAVIGGESVGKTTLARDLAAHFGSQWVPEYARTWLETFPGTPVASDFPRFLAGQRAMEQSLARQSHQVLFCDTDRLCTTVWADVFDVALTDDARAEALADRYDLTLLLAPDVPWVDDSVRYEPNSRRAFHERLKQRLREADRPNVVEVIGSWDQRFSTAIDAVDALIRG